MEFVQLNPELKKIMLQCLEITDDKLVCVECGNKTTQEKCSVFPALTKGKKADILCDSLLCMSSYFEKLESHEKEDKLHLLIDTVIEHTYVVDKKDNGEWVPTVQIKDESLLLEKMKRILKEED
jgi:hypothetical protein